MNVKTVKAKPVVETIQLTLTREEAGLLGYLCGRIGGGWDQPLSIRGIEGQDAQDIRQKVTSPIFDALHQYRRKEY